MASIRETIETTLSGNFKNILSASGYNTNVQLVSNIWKNINEISPSDLLPAIYFRFTPETRVNDYTDTNKYQEATYIPLDSTENAYICNFEIIVAGYSSIGNGEKLIADIVACVNNYKSISSDLRKISGVRKAQIKMIDRLNKTNIDAVGLILEIEYRESSKNYSI